MKLEVVVSFYFLSYFYSFFFFFSYYSLSLFLLLLFLFLKWQRYIHWILHLFELNESGGVPQGRHKGDENGNADEVYLDSQWKLSSRQIISETHWSFGHPLIQGPWQPSNEDLVCFQYVFLSPQVALVVESSLLSLGMEELSSCWGPVFPDLLGKEQDRKLVSILGAPAWVWLGHRSVEKMDFTYLDELDIMCFYSWYFIICGYSKIWSSLAHWYRQYTPWALESDSHKFEWRLQPWWSWASPITSLALGFLMCKMATTITRISSDGYKN